MKDKIKLIDKICELHPSSGVDKGWSTYTGGMADTGYWFFRKMLDVPMLELQNFLDEADQEHTELNTHKPNQKYEGLTMEETTMKHQLDLECKLFIGEDLWGEFKDSNIFKKLKKWE